MYRPLAFALLLALSAPVMTQSVLAQSDFAQIEEVIGHYFQGHATGDGLHFEQAFHPDALMFSAGSDGEMRRTELRTWFDGRNDPAPDEADRHRRIVALDVSGSVATAKLELDYPGVLLHDYMTLVKADGRWQIVNKVFVAYPRED